MVRGAGPDPGKGGDGADGVIWFDADTISATGTVTPTYLEP